MKKLILTFIMIATFLTLSCSKKNNERSIAVFLPGIIADSPTYRRVAEGVTKAIEEWNLSCTEKDKIKLTIIEAGTTQSQWQPKITALAASKNYELIISSNPSMPELCIPIAEKFPNQKFILLDSFCDTNPQIASVSYDQRTQAFLSGYIGALYSKSKKLALIGAQEYPIMNEIFLPYFTRGAQAAIPEATVDFRIVGNWFDATKGAELTRALVSNGVDLILPICGGASQGVIATALEKNIHLVWFDEDGFFRAPGTIISCTMINQDKIAYESTMEYLNKKTVFGTAKVVGTLNDGYMTYVDYDKNYIHYVSEEIRNKMDNLIESIKNGSYKID